MGAAFSRDLPGQSRLKTAPTIQNQPIPNYQVSLLIRLAAFQASGAARMKLHVKLTANRRITNIEPQNFEGWFRFAQSF